MASVGRRSDGFGREVVLGLLAEEPANCYQLDRRLARRFGSAGYTNGMARQAIKGLIEEELVRVLGVERGEESDGGLSRRSTVYEVTSRGVDHFQRWMWAAISTPPVLAIHAVGVAVCDEEQARGVRSIAAAIERPGRSRPMAISVTVPAQRMSVIAMRKKLGHPVRKAAERI